jgi:mono/diheme cytochrome c family protein
MRSWIGGGMALLVALTACERGGGEAGPVLDEARVEEGPPPGELPPGITAEQGAEGGRLYRTACIMCHGENAEGTQLGPALATGEWARGGGSFDDIVEVVTEGAPAAGDFLVPMPPRGDGTFTDDQVRAVAAYAYSLSRERAAPPADTVSADG